MIKSFKLNNLKKISKHEVDLIKTLYEYLPATDARNKIHIAIRKTLMKHLGQDVRYFPSTIVKMNSNEYLSSLPEPPILVVLGLEPIGKKIIIEIDHNVANLIINKLLGGAEGSLDELRPLTETEQGVLQYLVMQILAQVYGLTGSEPRVHFRFEKFIFNASEVDKFVRIREGVYILKMDISLGQSSGFLKIVFPEPFLDEFDRLQASSRYLKSEKNYFAHNLNKWSFIKTSLWAEVGNSLLSPVDMKDLEAGDIILLDEAYVNLDKKKMSGNVKLHFGTSETVIDSKLIETAPNKVKCKLDAIQ